MGLMASEVEMNELHKQIWECFNGSTSQVFFYSFPMSLRHTVTCTHIYLDTPTQYKYAYIHTYIHTYTCIYTIFLSNCSMALKDGIRHNIDKTAKINQLVGHNCIKRFR